jgi:hypothetical protein
MNIIICRKIQTRKAFLFSCLVLLFSAFASCSIEIDTYPKIEMNWQPVDSINAELPSGIRLYAGENDDTPLRAWYVLIKEKKPEIYTKIVVSDDSTDNRETISSFAQDLGATVVVNGGYFTMNQTPARHYGLLVSGGKVIRHATNFVIRDSIYYQTARAAIGFLNEDDIDISWVTSKDDTIYYWSTPPAHKPGQPSDLPDNSAADIWKVRDAISAGPALVIDKKIRITTDEEVFFGTSIPKTHPRTAIGYTKKGELIVMVVDGRQIGSRGVTWEELATLMLELKAVEAINLDGGGSSTLVVNNILINRPTGGTTEREVMSAIATFVN